MRFSPRHRTAALLVRGGYGRLRAHATPLPLGLFQETLPRLRNTRRAPCQTCFDNARFADDFLHQTKDRATRRSPSAWFPKASWLCPRQIQEQSRLTLGIRKKTAPLVRLSALRVIIAVGPGGTHPFNALDSRTRPRVFDPDQSVAPDMTLTRNLTGMARACAAQPYRLRRVPPITLWLSAVERSPNLQTQGAGWSASGF